MREEKFNQGYKGRDTKRVNKNKDFKKNYKARDIKAERSDDASKDDDFEITIESVVSGDQEMSNDQIEGRNAVMEALRSGRTIDKVFLQNGIYDNTIAAILKKLKGSATVINYVEKQRLDSMSESGHHQGIIAKCASYDYAEMDDIFALAEKKGEAPFVFILDEIEDPHNLGAIIRTANICGAHGVIIPKHRAVGLTSTVIKASAGAVNFTPVVKVTNIAKTIDELKDRGMWFACADMDGEVMYKTNLTGSIGLVIGNEGNGVSRLVREKCDYVVSVPQKGEINSLNASVAAGVLAYEIVRQRGFKNV